jgi:hypothetical protein
LTNFVDAPECKRCKAMLDAPPMTDAPLFAPSPVTAPTFFPSPAAAPQPSYYQQPLAAPPKSKSKFGAVTLGILLLMCGSYAARTVLPQFFASRVEDKIIRMCSELNKKMPIMVDSETRLDNVSPLPGKSFAYNYTLLNDTAETLDVPTLKAAMTPQITNRALTTKEFQPILTEGVTVIYKYFDKNGKYLFEIPVKK